ncbi:MAG: PKD domain-containing protein, partial [Thermoplasmata archaeon]
NNDGIIITSPNNNITDNNISSNINVGISLGVSSNNKIYHNNFINNTIQAEDGTGNGNQWDNGYPSGGNYWSNHLPIIDNFKGPLQDIPGPDGIHDFPYEIDTDSADRYPLAMPDGWRARTGSDSDLVFGDPTIKPQYPDAFKDVDISISIIDDGDVLNAQLFYSYDNTSWDMLDMDLSDPPNATATIPAPMYPTLVYFYINATDNEGNFNETSTYSYLAGSELVLTSENISFFSDPTEDGSMVSINANIFNEGGSLNGIEVMFFLGDPDLDNNREIDIDTIEIGIDIIDIGDFSSILASTEWIPPDIGVYEIYVWVDPINAIEEIDEWNNLAGNTLSVFNWVDTFDDMSRTESIEEISYINGDALIYKGQDHDFDDSEEGFTKNDDYEFSEVFWDSAKKNVYVNSDRQDVEDEIFSKDLPILFKTDFPSWTLSARWCTSQQGNWQAAFPIFITDHPTTDIEGQPNTIFFHYSSQDGNLGQDPWYHLRYRGSDGLYYIDDLFIGTANTEYLFSISYDANNKILFMGIYDTYGLELYNVSYNIGLSPGDDFILGKIGVASDGQGDSSEPTTKAWTDDINLSVVGDMGNIKSIPIDLQPDKRWSALYIDRTEPENTFINVSILDIVTDLPVPGFSNLTEDIIDISPLDPLLYPSIILVGKFICSETISPILHYWAIDWDTTILANAGADGYIDEGIPFQFNGSGSSAMGGIVNYAWDIDASDGVDWQSPDYSGSTLWDPWHTYQIPGIYTVTLNVTDSNGYWDLDTMILFVRDITKPVVDAGEDATINKGTPHTFDASSSYDPEGGTIVYYNWSFGDGSFANGSNPTPEHLYSASGVYIVTLNITDERGGNWNETTITINVRGMTPPGIVQPISDIELKEDDPPYILNLQASAIDYEDLPQDLNWTITGINSTLYTVSGQESSKLIITPNSNVYGNDLVTLWVHDSDDLSDSQPLWINITPVNDKPFFSPLPPDLTVTMDVPYTFDYTPYISDIDNEINELEISTNDYVYTSISNHKVMYQYPSSMVNEHVFIVLTVSDGIDNTSEFIRIFISDDNVPALQKELPDVTLYEREIKYGVFDLDEYFYDPDGDAIYYSYGYTHISITINEDHTVDFNAESSWYGEETVTFRAHDPDFAIVEDTILVTVLPVNDPPSISNVPDLVVHYNASYSFDLSPYITDEDNSHAELSLLFMEFSDGTWVVSDYINVSEENNLKMVITYPPQFLNMTFQVRIIVSDGVDFESDTINIEVSNDWPPVLLMEIPNVVFYEDDYIYDYFNVNN